MKKIVIGVLAFLVILTVGLYLYFRSFVPDYTEDLFIEGITGKVTIERNEFAVPYITAENMEDLYFAWGYVNAQDRMFQLEATRRISQGRISEFAGDSAMKKDIFLRAVGFHEVAQREVDKLDPVYRNYFQRYVDGINHYLKTKGPNLYMKLLGLESEEWTAADALAVGMMLNWSLAYNMKHEILYYKMAKKIGVERLNDLMNLVPEGTPTIADDYAALDETGDEFFAMLDDFGRLFGSRSASNNWVVGNSRTAHDGVLFASDMQVHDNKLPSDFYYVRVKSGDFTCTGAHVVGAPFIASGYNNHMAWGLTNNGADMVDLYRENIDWKKKTYRFRGKDYPLKEKKVTITVKGKGPVKKSLYYVGDRPVISEVFDDLGIDISLDWTAFDAIDFQGFFMLNHAKNYEEFYRATARIRMSPQNCLYADREGNVAFRVIGSQPLRKKGTGNIIRDGETDDRSWEGNIPHDRYPSVKNPDRGYIITANNKVVNDYPRYLNGIYSPRYRYDNIAKMMKGRNDLTVEDMKKMQVDTNTVMADKIRDIVKKHVTTGDNERIKEAVDTLLAWDGNVAEESSAASIYNTFYVRFAYQTFRDELGDKLAEEFVGERYISMERFFDMVEKGSGFFDDTATGEKETVSDIANRAFKETLELLEEATGSSKIKKWQWKKIHSIRYDHMLGNAAFLRPVVSYGPIPFEGDSETNNRARFKEVAPPYTAYLASAPRMVVKFDPDPVGHMMLITGENEYFMSPHRTDMIKAWHRHEYFKVEDPEFRYTMTIKPGK